MLIRLEKNAGAPTAQMILLKQGAPCFPSTNRQSVLPEVMLQYVHGQDEDTEGPWPHWLSAREPY